MAEVSIGLPLLTIIVRNHGNDYLKIMILFWRGRSNVLILKIKKIIIVPVVNFYFLIFTSVIICLRFNSRLFIWIRLEINILSFLPIISSGLNIELENFVKYFLI